MKPIALIDTRAEVAGSTMSAAFKANQRFQKREAARKFFVRVKIATLAKRLAAGAHVRACDLA